jgi:hypothetical protein
MKYEIEIAENGYIIKAKSGEEVAYYVCEESDEENGAIISLLEKLGELLGYNYDKFSSTNLNISFNKKGHKVE